MPFPSPPTSAAFIYVAWSVGPRFRVSWSLFPRAVFTDCWLPRSLLTRGKKGATRNPKPNPNPKPRAGKTLTLTLSRQTLARLGFLSAPVLLRAAVAANCGLDGPEWLPTGRCRRAAEMDLAADCRACPSLGGRDCFHFDFAPHSAVAEFAPRPAAGDDGDAPQALPVIARLGCRR